MASPSAAVTVAFSVAAADTATGFSVDDDGDDGADVDTGTACALV